MACSKHVLQGQSPALCQLCEVDPKIKWKCIDCDLLLCTKCKDKIHSKVKTAEEHIIINIKEVGKQSDESDKTGYVGIFIGQDTRHTVNKGPISLKLSIMQVYTTKFHVDYIQVSLDDSLWIGSTDYKKTRLFSFKSSKNLKKVKLGRDKLKIISSFNVDVYDIAITPTNDLILADCTPKLKQILYYSNKVTDASFCVEPYHASCVHVTRKNNVVVGAASKEGFGGCVYVMDINGVLQQTLKHDHSKTPLFTRPFRITSTSAGTLCVLDLIAEDPPELRLVILGQGEVISVYTGHPDINSDKKPFIPAGVVTTSNDNIIVTDYRIATLHILNNTGNFLTYYNTREIGIVNPHSLAFNTAGQFSILYIGCVSGDRKEGKLYKLTLSGC